MNEVYPGRNISITDPCLMDDIHELNNCYRNDRNRYR